MVDGVGTESALGYCAPHARVGEWRKALFLQRGTGLCVECLMEMPLHGEGLASRAATLSHLIESGEAQGIAM